MNNQLIWKHLLHSGVTHYCGAPTVQVCAGRYGLQCIDLWDHSVDWHCEPPTCEATWSSYYDNRRRLRPNCTPNRRIRQEEHKCRACIRFNVSLASFLLCCSLTSPVEIRSEVSNFTAHVAHSSALIITTGRHMVHLLGVTLSNSTKVCRLRSAPNIWPDRATHS